VSDDGEPPDHQLQRGPSLAERLDLMEKKLDALCRYLLPAHGRYAPPGVTYPWQKQLQV